MYHANSLIHIKRQPIKSTGRDRKYNKFLNKQRRYSNRSKGRFPKEYLKDRKTHLVFNNWRLIFSNLFNGYAVQADNSPLVREGLERLINTVVTSYLANSKIFTCRVDLYFPLEWSNEKRVEIDYYSKFIKSLNEQMTGVEKQLKSTDRSDGKSNERDLFVRHFRVIEYGDGRGRKKSIPNDQDRIIKARGIHIHALLMFNGHQFSSLGDLNDLSRNGLGRMIIAAWASAVFGYSRSRPEGIEPSDWRYAVPNWENIAEVQRQGLVNFSRQWTPSMDPVYEERERKTRDQIGSIIFAASYLCKASQKKRFNKQDGFFKIFSGSHLPKKGVERMKGFHRCQVRLPLCQGGGIDQFGESERLLPKFINGGYIRDDVKLINDYLDRFKGLHESFVVIEENIKIPEQYVEIKGKSFVDILTQNYLKEVAYRFNSQRIKSEELIGGLYKEVIGKNKQRYLHWVIFVDDKLYQEMGSSGNYFIERHLCEVGQKIINDKCADAELAVQLREVVKYEGEFFHGDFGQVKDICSQLARSSNTPEDLVMPFVRQSEVGFVISQ